MYISVEIPFGEATATIGGYYYPGESAVMYLSNGDPGYPEEPPEFDIDSFTIGGYDVLSDIQEMYVRDSRGVFIRYLDSIEEMYMEKAKESYSSSQLPYED